MQIAAVKKLFSTHSRLATIVVTGMTIASFGSAANATPYSTSGASTQFSLGDQLGIFSVYDVLQIGGASGSINPNTDIALNTLKFTVGPNSFFPGNYSFKFNETVTVGSTTANLTVPFNLSVGASDVLSILGGTTTLSILVGGNIWSLVVDQLTLKPSVNSFGVGSETASLMAHVTESPAATPLPAALVLFGTGLGAMGLFGRRKKSKVGVVSQG